jgi:hypothetical protein
VRQVLAEGGEVFIEENIFWGFFKEGELPERNSPYTYFLLRMKKNMMGGLKQTITKSRNKNKFIK